MNYKTILNFAQATYELWEKVSKQISPETSDYCLGYKWTGSSISAMLNNSSLYASNSFVDCADFCWKRLIYMEAGWTALAYSMEPFRLAETRFSIIILFILFYKACIRWRIRRSRLERLWRQRIWTVQQWAISMRRQCNPTEVRWDEVCQKSLFEPTLEYRVPKAYAL